MTIATREFNAAEYLDSEEAMAEFLSAAVETGDMAFIAESAEVVAQARAACSAATMRGRASEA